MGSKAVVGRMVVAAAIAGIGFGAAIGVAPPATAAPIDLGGCAVTDNGTPLDLSTASPTDDSDAAFTPYADGDYFVVHGPFNPVTPKAPNVPMSVVDEPPPLCGVQVHRSGGTITFGPPTWLWCLDFSAKTCGERPQQAAASPLDADQAALVGWLVAAAEESGLTEQYDLIAQQARIWCVTDGASDLDADQAGVPGRIYVPGVPSIQYCDDRSGPGTGYRNWLDDNILPIVVKSSDSLTAQALGVTGGGDPLPGTEQRVRVTSSLAAVSVDQSDFPVTICAGQSGASFTGSTLHLTPGQPVELCTQSAIADSGSIVVRSVLDGNSLGSVFGYGDTGDSQWPATGGGCQVFVPHDVSPLTLAATAAVSWAAPPTTTVAPSTTSSVPSTTTNGALPPGPTTTSVNAGARPPGLPGSPGTIPATGASTAPQVILAAGLLLVGGAVTIIGRRRQPGLRRR